MPDTAPIQFPEPAPTGEPAKQWERGQLGRVARTIRREFMRYDLTDRERRIAELILDLCASWGIHSVAIPQLDMFAKLTGMSRGNVSTTLASLVEIALIHVEIRSGGPFYSVNLNQNEWKLRVRVPRDTYRQVISHIQECNRNTPSNCTGCANLPPADSGKSDFFHSRDAAHFFDGEIPFSGTVSVVGTTTRLHTHEAIQSPLGAHHPSLDHHES